MNARSKELRALRRHLKDLLHHRDVLHRSITALEKMQRAWCHAGDVEHGNRKRPLRPSAQSRKSAH